MNDLIKKIQHKGYEIELFYDSDADSPDVWGNEDNFIVYDHRDFTVKRDGFDPSDIFETMQKGKKLFEGFFFFPVYAYIHSGISLSLGRTGVHSCPWDTSFKGFALIKKGKGSGTAEKAREIAQAIIDDWNDYLSGNIYGYRSEFGSCWGYYGDEGRDQAIEEAKGEIDYEINKKLQNHFKRLKAYIRNKVNILNRTEAPIF